MADSLEHFGISKVALPARFYSVAEVSSLQGQPAQWFTAGYMTEENTVSFGTVPSSALGPVHPLLFNE
jgi:hypothetical protein